MENLKIALSQWIGGVGLGGGPVLSLSGGGSIGLGVGSVLSLSGGGGVFILISDFLYLSLSLNRLSLNCLVKVARWWV